MRYRLTKIAVSVWILLMSLAPFCIVRANGIHNASTVYTNDGNDSIPNDITSSVTKLGEVTVSAKRTTKDTPLETTLNTISLNRDVLDAVTAGSLMQTLATIPGVQALNIGSGSSKPAIRGLGFNRMVVSENGIKHEGQQWGEDHGLEIDQFSVDRADVIKGPAALVYGSDAISGVISLQNAGMPNKKFGGSMRLIGKSNNESIGGNLRLFGRHGSFWWKGNLTYVNYGDTKVPADSIQYYSYYIRLWRNRLRNTAGREHDASATLGYSGNGWSTSLYVSDINSKSGFFADAHGLEVRLSEIDYNRSSRDIDLPYHWVNHLKIASLTKWNLGTTRWDGTLSWQNNIRVERSEPVSHGYMPKPDGTLERRFAKNTFTASVGMYVSTSEDNTITSGFNIEYQHNRRGGWGFVIPDFQTLSEGLYVFDRLQLSDSLTLTGGLRIDGIHSDIRSYTDWYKTPQSNGDSIYVTRAADIRRNFGSLTWSLGMNYSTGGWNIKANVGKSFRAPTPKELGIDGINYHIFRYEKGNPDLSPEKSYQVDLGVEWAGSGVEINVDPYINYFPNYIYLNPTSTYKEGLQEYRYTQSKVLRYGLEATASYNFLRYWRVGVKGEYLYARQLSGDKKGYSLPFSPPASVGVELTYTLPHKGESGMGFVSIDFKAVARQDRIVPPEKTTAGYGLLNLAAGKSFSIEDCKLSVNLRVNNILNRRYYDHTGYYRLIDVPEPGRDISLSMIWDF